MLLLVIFHFTHVFSLTTGTGRNTRTHSNADDAAVVGKIHKALQDFNKTSQKENKEKEGLDKNSMGSTKQRYLSQESKSALHFSDSQHPN